jgi:cytochrome c553
MLSSPRGEENHLKVLAAIGVILAGVAVLAAALFTGAVWLGQRKLDRVVAVKVVPVPFAKSAAPQLKLGRYLFESRGCAECHAADGHGLVFIDAPNGFYVKSPDITTGPGGVVAGYTEGDWVRAIRHGVNPAGHALVVMPSGDYAGMSDADLAALVAYVRSLPPVAGAPPDWPAAARLVPGPGYVMGRYDTLGKFMAMMRGGKRPDGTAVSTVMPFASLRNLDDTDLGALYTYLTTAPGERIIRP